LALCDIDLAKLAEEKGDETGTMDGKMGCFIFS